VSGLRVSEIRLHAGEFVRIGWLTDSGEPAPQLQIERLDSDHVEPLRISGGSTQWGHVFSEPGAYRLSTARDAQRDELTQCVLYLDVLPPRLQRPDAVFGIPAALLLLLLLGWGWGRARRSPATGC
jgi:hypothetical protein